ncbi:MAG: aminopeptidase P family protein [Chloroflexi bacterium]|nr:aminopeptidase P family protein [Chloroflexota bacterium]
MARPVTEEATVVADRLARTQAALRSTGAVALLAGVGADLRYLTGYSAHALERLTLLVLPATGAATLVVPRLEAMAAEACPAAVAGLVDLVAWDETDDPYALVAGRLSDAGASGAARLLVDPGLPARHLLALERVLPGRAFGLATDATRALRIVKDAGEIELLRRAARAADRVVAQIAAGRLIGRTEADVSREVRERLVAEGHEAASFAIVGSGPNSASPHHDPGARVIRPGDPIVLDIGGTLSGYGSDITRMLWVTGGDPSRGPSEEFLAVFDLVRRANEAATAAVRAGVGCAALDEVAREIIRAGGHGDAFIHRLGHGIGLDAHEEPYLVAGSAEVLEPGHAFSIEPGIYLAGRFGVRLEDIVVCAADGPDVLNRAPHDLMVVDG